MECLRQSLRQLLKKGWIWGHRESGGQRAAETLGGEARALRECALASRGSRREQSLAGNSGTPTGLPGRSPIGSRAPRSPARGGREYRAGEGREEASPGRDPQGVGVPGPRREHESLSCPPPLLGPYRRKARLCTCSHTWRRHQHPPALGGGSTSSGLTG